MVFFDLSALQKSVGISFTSYDLLITFASIVVFVIFVDFCRYLIINALIGRSTLSWIIAKLKTDSRFDNRSLRTSFRTMKIPVGKPTGGSHEEAASYRTSANKFIDDFVRSFGGSIFSVSMSSSDQRKGLKGTRYFYGTKDLMMNYQDSELEENDFLKMIDVDYYDDVLPQALETGLPILLYTFTPTAAGHTSGPMSFFFNEDGSVTQTFATDSYTHHVWKFDSSMVTSGHYSPWSLFYWLEPVNVYAVESRAHGNHRSVVLLAPVCRLPRILLKLMGDYQSMRPLQRLKPIHTVNKEGEKVVMFSVSDKEGVKQVVGLPKREISTTIPINIWTHLETYVSEGKVSLGSFRSELKVNKVDNLLAGPILKALGARLVSDRVYWNHIVDYTWWGDREWERVDSKPSLHVRASAFGPSLPHAPMRNSVNLDAAYVERTLKVRPHNAASPPSPYVRSCMLDFVEELIGEHKHSKEIISFCDVESRIRPSKLADFTNAAKHQLFSVGDKVKRFLKRESYGTIKAPRDIRDFSPADRPGQASIVYSVEMLIKDTHWYVFGLTPQQLEERVTHFLSSANECDENDFSKFDGTHGVPSRILELLFLQNAFNPRYHMELETWHSTLYNRKMTGKLVSQYERLSGGFDTSLFNSLCAAFADYLALRKAGFEHAEAYVRIGLHGGDDSLQRVTDQTSFAWANAQMGFVAKQSPKKQGQPVSFLGRFYGPSCWFNQPCSIIDVPRLMTKFHTSVQDPRVPADQVFAEKAYSLLATDKNCPPLRLFARKLLTFRHHLKPGQTDDMSYVYKQMLSSTDKFEAFSCHSWEWFPTATVHAEWFDNFVNSVYRYDDAKVLGSVEYLHLLAGMSYQPPPEIPSGVEADSRTTYEPARDGVLNEQTLKQTVNNPSDRHAAVSDRSDKTKRNSARRTKKHERNEETIPGEAENKKPLPGRKGKKVETTPSIDRGRSGV